jgi:hypothetical protein
VGLLLLLLVVLVLLLLLLLLFYLSPLYSYNGMTAQLGRKRAYRILDSITALLRNVKM